MAAMRNVASENEKLESFYSEINVATKTKRKDQGIERYVLTKFDTRSQRYSIWSLRS